MAKPGASGIKRIIDATKYSFKGFRSGFKTEAAIRQELFLAIIFNIVAFFIATSPVMLILLVIMPWLVFTFELVNSAIEACIDRIGDEYHELSGKAKDLGSACVFVLLMLTLFTYVIAFLDYFKIWTI